MVQARIELYERGLAPMYRLILLDYSMPVMDGPMTAKNLRKLFAASQKLSETGEYPIIYCCTAYTEATFKQIALDSGMDDFYSKPITTAVLTKILTQIGGYL